MLLRRSFISGIAAMTATEAFARPTSSQLLANSLGFSFEAPSASLFDMPAGTVGHGVTVVNGLLAANIMGPSCGVMFADPVSAQTWFLQLGVAGASEPRGVYSLGGFVWVSDIAAGTLIKVQPPVGGNPPSVVWTITGLVRPYGICGSATHLFVSETAANRLAKINPSINPAFGNPIVGRVGVCTNPLFSDYAGGVVDSAYSGHTNLIFIPGFSGGDLSVVDADTMTLLETWNPGSIALYMARVAGDGVYISDYAGNRMMCWRLDSKRLSYFPVVPGDTGIAGFTVVNDTVVACLSRMNAVGFIDARGGGFLGSYGTVVAHPSTNCQTASGDVWCATAGKLQKVRTSFSG